MMKLNEQAMREMVKQLEGFIPAFAINNKEEAIIVEDKKKFDYKETASKVWGFVKDGSKKVVDFSKKHVGKASLGLGALTVAGTFTSGLLGAMVGGMTIYASVVAAYEYIKAKKEKAEVDRDALLNGLSDSLLYGTIGAMTMYCLAGVAVGLLANVFTFSYVGFSYMAYFIVA